RTPTNILPTAAQTRNCCQGKDLVTLCRGPGDATRRHHDLDMQVRCGDGIRPVPANLREPQTTGGLRADTMVTDTKETLSDPLYCGIMRRTNHRRPARSPRAIEVKSM
ncbi:hypothetical protein GGF50DRAFT_68853, partial [Schizophyllum commune]